MNGVLDIGEWSSETQLQLNIKKEFVDIIDHFSTCVVGLLHNCHDTWYIL